MNIIQSVPLISSYLDTDFYKITIANFLFQNGHSNVPVVYEFRNRTSDVNLNEYFSAEELEEHLASFAALKFYKEEIDYLRSLGYFSEEFLSKMMDIHLSPPQVKKAQKDFSIRVEGTWFDSIWWEIPILSIISHLYVRKCIKRYGIDENVFDRSVIDKLHLISSRPNIKIIEFGTRRRAGLNFQRQALERTLEICPEQLIGTSNVMLAKELGLKPIGTVAHECDQVYSGIYRDRLAQSPQIRRNDWRKVYGDQLAIHLPDTFGSDYFWRSMSQEEIEQMAGFRPDSGNLPERIQQGIDTIRKAECDPAEKVCVPSDGLNWDSIVAIDNAFANLVKLVNGVGSWYTGCCNLGIKPCSLVVKVVKANGHGVCKLSDNLEKAMGDPKDIEKYCKVFGYTNTLRERCTF